MSTAMNPLENPDAAPGADIATAAPAGPGIGEAATDSAPATQAIDLPPLPTTSAEEALPPAPAALPPAFTGFEAPGSGPATEADRPAAAAASTPLLRPRVRWAGIVWGLVFAAIAATGIWILADATRQEAFMEWMLGLTSAAAAAYAVLVVGGFALIAGIVGLARRAQRAGERRRATSTPS